MESQTDLHVHVREISSKITQILAAKVGKSNPTLS